MDESRRQFYVFVAGLFGLTIGSFLNVCIFRLPRNCMSIAKGRSKCPGCREEIAWFDNIPVVSWLILGGKCRRCGMGISPRYMLIELLTGALFAWAAYAQLYRPALDDGVQRVTLFVIQAWLICAIVVQTFVDIDWEILLDEINWSGLAFGLIAGAAFPEVLFGDVPRSRWLQSIPQDLQGHAYGLAQSAIGAGVGAAVMWAVGVVGYALFRRRAQRLKMDTAMGLGDVKYIAFLGAFLGGVGMGLTFLAAVFAGAAWGVGRALVTLRLGRPPETVPDAQRLGPVWCRLGKVPFGPFLSIGALAVVFARPQLMQAVDAYLGMFRGPQ